MGYANQKSLHLVADRPFELQTIGILYFISPVRIITMGQGCHRIPFKHINGLVIDSCAGPEVRQISVITLLPFAKKSILHFVLSCPTFRDWLNTL